MSRLKPVARNLSVWIVLSLVAIVVVQANALGGIALALAAGILLGFLLFVP